MIYLTPPTGSAAVHDAIRAGALGMITTPAQGNVLIDGATWAADNGCFGGGYPGDNEWLSWLEAKDPTARHRCLFATAPDVVGDAAATETRSAPLLAPVRELGYRVAYVAQDGLENRVVPWDQIDAVFIGGSTAWKLGPHARTVAGEAKLHGKWVHMGRVNSERRIAYARMIGCDSADGTILRFGPSRHLPAVLAWSRLDGQHMLDFDGVT